MKTYTYTPSINIIRDFDQDFNYIVTPNTKKVYNQLISNYQKGSRSFNLIGAYGTGKSSFILAIEQSLRGKKENFEKNQSFEKINHFEFVNIIGENNSMIDSFADQFQIEKTDIHTSNLISAIDSYYKKINGALVIVVDEFGKFLEFAAKNNTEKELYFIQQLAELANDKSKEILFITVLHQNFNAYSLDLSKVQVDEWNKVKGRLIELNFNEPVEQLLFLASQKLQELKFYFPKNEDIELIHQAIYNSKLFPLRDFNNIEFSESIFPFDLLSAALLTITLQEYAQNERSLFLFIENEDEFGLRKFDNKHNPFYNISCVYDYLTYYHFSFLSTKYNPHLNQWNAIRDSIERAEVFMNDAFADASKVIKTIGLLNIFSNKGGSIDREFIEYYGKYALGIDKPWEIIEELIKNKIFHYTKYDNRLKILLGTDLDFEIAINEAGNLIERVKDVTLPLNKYFDFPVLSAKKISYTIGTPRYFSFLLSDSPILRTPENEIDGFINLVFNKDLSEEYIQKFSSNCQEAILFGWFTKTDRIEDTLFEIEKINKVIEKNSADLVAVKELRIILIHYLSLLNHYVIESLYSDDLSVKWYFAGEAVRIRSQKDFNNQLSRICEIVYNATPIFKSELVNKSKISGTIAFARKNLFKRILNDSDKIDFGFESDKFPPEKTIFMTLLQNTGIYGFENSSSFVGRPDDESFEQLWDTCLEFLENTKQLKRPVTDLIEKLKQRPFKLKQGFIDFWIPLFLIAHKNDFALFHRDKLTGNMAYIPYLNDEVLELIYRVPTDYYIKKFDLTEARLKLFNEYREVLNQIEQDKFSNESFIETFRPFLIFYKNLPAFSKTTSRLSEKALKLRKAIENSIDPEEAFFNDIPSGLGLSLESLLSDDKEIESLAITIKESIHEINSAFENLIIEIESFINLEVIGENVSFPTNKEYLQKRYRKLKADLIKPKLQVFYNRITTVLNDRNSWINSIAQAVIGKSLENITDEEINLIKHRILENIRELDNYTELSQQDIDAKKEEVIKIEVTSFLQGLSKKYIRIPKSKIEKINTLERSFKEQLKENDKTFNIALLTRLLQDELNNEES